MKALLFIILFSLFSCAAPTTKDGSLVRIINLIGANDCKFIGIVEAEGGFFYSSMPEAKRDMYNKLRNETALRGGNAFAVTIVDVESGFSLAFAQADAYDCP